MDLFIDLFVDCVAVYPFVSVEEIGRVNENYHNMFCFSVNEETF